MVMTTMVIIPHRRRRWQQGERRDRRGVPRATTRVGAGRGFESATYSVFYGQ